MSCVNEPIPEPCRGGARQRGESLLSEPRQLCQSCECQLISWSADILECFTSIGFPTESRGPGSSRRCCWLRRVWQFDRLPVPDMSTPRRRGSIPRRSFQTLRIRIQFPASDLATDLLSEPLQHPFISGQYLIAMHNSRYAFREDFPTTVAPKIGLVSQPHGWARRGDHEGCKP